MQPGRENSTTISTRNKNKVNSPHFALGPFGLTLDIAAARAISLRQAATTAGLLGEGGVAHRALEDARLTLECFRHYIGRLAPREPAELAK